MSSAQATPATHAGFEPATVIAVVLLMPIALYLAHYAGLARVLYPASNLLLAAWLYARRSPWFAGQCLMVFCFVSLVRRLIDVQAGWDPANPVLLTPYLCGSLTVFSFFSYWARPRPRYLGPMLLLLACVIYGAVLALLEDRLAAGAADLLKWSIGPLFAIYLLEQRERLAELRGVLEGTLVGSATAIAAYGIFQYVDPPIWDAEWMKGVADLGMTSIGQPEPFAVRVFSTLNSPGSLGAILSAAIVVASKHRLAIALPGMALMAVALALCQYRTLWAATALAVALVIVSRPVLLRPTNLLAIIGVAASLAATTLIPDISQTVSQRASTLTALQGDESLEERLSQYRALTRDDDLIVGHGLGQNSVVRKLDGLAPVVIDSGLIDIWSSLGVIAGTLFLAGLACLVSPLFTTPAPTAPHLPFDRAIVLTTFLQLPMGSAHIGELGFCAWLFLALGLAALPALNVPLPHPVVNSP
jgi:hypothetical protein